jgi:hypothetical protein
MHHALIVRRLHGFTDPLCDLQRFIDGNRTAADSILQRLAFDEFENEIARVAGLGDVVDRSNARMVQRRQHFSLALKTHHPFGIAGECLGQHLDRHFTLQLRIARTVHLCAAIILAAAVYLRVKRRGHVGSVATLGNTGARRFGSKCEPTSRQFAPTAQPWAKRRTLSPVSRPDISCFDPFRNLLTLTLRCPNWF